VNGLPDDLRFADRTTVRSICGSIGESRVRALLGDPLWHEPTVRRSMQEWLNERDAERRTSVDAREERELTSVERSVRAAERSAEAARSSARRATWAVVIAVLALCVAAFKDVILTYL
jgi:hypothetical protein